MTIHNHPLVPRESSMPVITPVIPLNFVYPGLSLAQVFAIVKAYRKAALIILFTVLALTALVMTVWPRTYTATVTLMVNYEVNDPLNGKELPIGQVGSYIATQVELMQTPELLLAVVERLKLTEDRDFSSGYRGSPGTLQEWVARKVGKQLVIYQGQMGSQLIYVTYSANDPAKAARVANTVAEVYLTSSSARSLQTQLYGQKARLAKLGIAFAPRHPEVVELQSQINATQKILALQVNGASAAGSSTTESPAPGLAVSSESTFIAGGLYANVSLISHATPPVNAGKPKILTGIMLGGLAAGILGLGLPLGYELLNRRVRCRDDLERHHGIPVLVEFGGLPKRATTQPMRASA